MGCGISQLLYSAGYHLLACILGATSLYTAIFHPGLRNLSFLKIVLIILIIHIHFFYLILPQGSLQLCIGQLVQELHMMLDFCLELLTGHGSCTEVTPFLICEIVVRVC